MAHATIEWAILNEADPAACVGFFADKALPVAGPGAPLVSEFALMEYAAALGVTTESGFAQVGGILELRYRLPKLWGKVVEGRLPLWRARRIAAHTTSLPMAGAAQVDRHLAPVAHSCSWAQLDRTVEEAMVRFDPEAAEAKRREAAEKRHVDVHADEVSFDGTVRIDAEVDLADALDLEDALRGWVPNSRLTWAAPSPWMCVAPQRSATWPGASWRSGSKTPSPAGPWTWSSTSARTR